MTNLPNEPGSSPFGPQAAASGGNEASAAPDFALPPHPTRRGCLTACAVVLGLAATFLVFLALIALRLSDRDGLEVNDQQAMVAMDHEQRSAEIAAAFRTPRVDVDNNELVRIGDTINRIFQARLAEDQREVFRYLDPQGFIAQMERSGEVPSLTWLDRLAMARDIGSLTDGPLPFERFHIVSVRRISDLEVIVYLHAWDEDDVSSNHEQRYWMVRRPEGWKLADWEILVDGMTAATEYAILCEHQGDAGIQAYYDAYEQLADFYASYSEGNWSAAEKVLDRVEKYTIHPKLADQLRLRLAFCWYELGRWDNMQRDLLAIEHPERVWGADFGFMRWHEHQRAYPEAVEFADRVLAHMGASPEAYQVKADGCQALGRYDEAFDSLCDFMTCLPEVARPIRRLCELAEHVDLEMAAQALVRLPDAGQLAQDLAEFPHAWNHTRPVDLAERVLALANLGPEQAEYLAAIRLEMGFECEAALAALANLEQRTRDGELARKCAERRLDLLCRLQRPLEAYQTSRSPAEAFDRITTLFDEDELDLTSAQILDLVRLHEQYAPDEKWLPYYRAIAYRKLGQPEKALAEFRRGQDAFADDEETLATYDFFVVNMLAGQGEYRAAYDAACDKERAFARLASRSRDEENGPALRTLLAAHREQAQDHGWLVVYEAAALRLEGKCEEALQLIRESSFDEHESPAEAEAAIEKYKCWLRQGTWQEALRQDPDPERLIEELESILRESGQFDRLGALASAAETADVHPLVPFSIRMREAVATSADARVIRLATSLPASEWEQLDADDRHEWQMATLVALLRSARGDRPFREQPEPPATFDGVTARPLPSEQVGLYVEQVAKLYPVAQLLPMIVENDVDAVAARLASAPPDQGLVDQLAEYDVARPFFEEEAFAQLRRAYPSEYDRHPTPCCIYMLYARPVELDLDRLDTVLQACTGESARFGPLAGLSPVNVGTAVLAEAGDVRLVLSQLAAPADYQNEAVDETIRLCLDQHQHTVAITALRPIRRERAFAIMWAIAKELLNDDCVGIFCPDRSVFLDQPASDLARVAATDMRTLWTVGEYCWLNMTDAPAMSPGFSPQHARTLSAMEAFDPTAATPARIRVDSRVGPSVVSHWLRVLAVEDGEALAILEATDPVQAWPGPFRVSLPIIQDWE